MDAIRPGTTLGLDLFADIACPWCFIAYRRLRRAIDGAAALGVSSPTLFRWRAFQLDRELPDGGVEALSYYDSRLGGPAKRKAAWDHLSAIGEAEGIHFDFAAQRLAPNTTLAHRLILVASNEPAVGDGEPARDASPAEAWSEAGDPVAVIGPCDDAARAVDEGRRAAGHIRTTSSGSCIGADVVADALYSGFFECGLDLGDLGEMLDFLATRGIPIDADRVRTRLAAGDGTDRVREDMGVAAAVGIDAVPVVIADHRHAVWGAQPEIVFRRLLVVASAGGTLATIANGPLDRP